MYIYIYQHNKEHVQGCLFVRTIVRNFAVAPRRDGGACRATGSLAGHEPNTAAQPRTAAQRQTRQS